jgi:hypothetical protein
MKPHTTMSYLKPEDALWALGRHEGDTRIMMEVVNKESTRYLTAVNNSFGDYPAVKDEYLELKHLLELLYCRVLDMFFISENVVQKVIVLGLDLLILIRFKQD